MEIKEEKITLTLEPTIEEVVEEKPVVEEKLKEVDVKEAFSEEDLNPEELKMVNEFAKKIDITEAATVLQYGANSQQKIADFSDTALKNVRTKDLDTVGQTMADLVGELKGFKIDEEEKGIVAWFKKTVNKVDNLKNRYAKASDNVDKIIKILEEHQITLLKDIELLDQLYEKNLTNYKELSMYIMAGKKALDRIKNEELPKALEKAKQSGAPEDAQVANDLENAINRFEKKIHDLELTRVVAVQMSPQIRLVQNNDILMTEKIQSTLVNTIPIWKSQMLIALGLAHSKDALRVQSEVSDMTNKMLKENAKNLKQATIGVAKESERGIIDIETLKQTNADLLSTLEEVTRIQHEGREKRAQATMELRRIENEVNNRLVEIKENITDKQ
ncbi:MAG: toxic anion resistance protein [Erysipelotrichaceae bacterium]|nr:toxic anion resistance protein [Erysipelotrichaceae bacterium]